MSGKGSKYSELPARVEALEQDIERLKEQMYLLSTRVQQVAPEPGAVVTDEEILRDYREKKRRR